MRNIAKLLEDVLMYWVEKEFELKMRPCIDLIYKNTFRELCTINRTARDKIAENKFLIMDKEMAIDTFLYFDDGSTITFQEKVLKQSKQKYQSFTFEYQNDPKVNEPGEWFHLTAQAYFFGYANEFETGFLQYWILDILQLRLFLKNQIGIEELKSRYLRQNPKPAKSNFFAIPFNRIPNNVILIQSGEYK